MMAEDCLLFPSGRYAVVGNQTSVVAVRDSSANIIGYTHLVDTLLAQGMTIVKIFCPEHGFRGTAAAGAKVDNSTDPKTGLPIISLYGKNKKWKPAPRIIFSSSSSTDPTPTGIMSTVRCSIPLTIALLWACILCL